MWGWQQQRRTRHSYSRQQLRSMIRHRYSVCVCVCGGGGVREADFVGLTAEAGEAFLQQAAAQIHDQAHVWFGGRGAVMEMPDWVSFCVRRGRSSRMTVHCCSFKDSGKTMSAAACLCVSPYSFPPTKHCGE